MCGILGGFARSEQAAARLSENAEAMLASLAHRGNDGSGLARFRFDTERGFSYH